MSFLFMLQFISYPIPGIASNVEQIMIQFVQLDILMTNDWLVPWIVN